MSDSLRILVLRGDCPDSIQRPLLEEFAELFPNLKEIQLVGVYPAVPDYERTGTFKSPTISKNPEPVKEGAIEPSGLPPISISIHRSTQSHVTKHESHLTKFIKQYQASAHIKRANYIHLGAYHLEFAMSGTKEDRRYQSFWGEFAKRMKEACKVPATAVTICLDVLIDGEIRQFLVNRASLTNTMSLR